MNRDHYGTVTLIAFVVGCFIALGVLMAERPCLDCPILRSTSSVVAARPAQVNP